MQLPAHTTLPKSTRWSATQSCCRSCSAHVWKCPCFRLAKSPAKRERQYLTNFKTPQTADVSLLPPPKTHRLFFGLPAPVPPLPGVGHQISQLMSLLCCSKSTATPIVSLPSHSSSLAPTPPTPGLRLRLLPLLPPLAPPPLPPLAPPPCFTPGGGLTNAKSTCTV